MKNGIVIILASGSLLVSACATTNQTKRLSLTAGGVGVGVAVGLSRPSEPQKNAVLYGSLVGLGTLLASELIFSDEKETARLKVESEKLKRENEILKREIEPLQTAQGSSLLSSPLPKDVQKLVVPGNWRRFKIDRWAHDDDNENQWIRQTEIFEITPPGSNNR